MILGGTLVAGKNRGKLVRDTGVEFSCTLGIGGTATNVTFVVCNVSFLISGIWKNLAGFVAIGKEIVLIASHTFVRDMTVNGTIRHFGSIDACVIGSIIVL